MKKNKKGFTLAELLIVVAIIGVLVAISIPIFNNQLRKARLATNQANARAAYAAWVAMFFDQGMPVRADSTYYRYDATTGKIQYYGPTRARNFGATVCTTEISHPNTDISSWNTTTKVGVYYDLGSRVCKYWQIQVKNGKVIAYYAYTTPE
ncbi:prepilin-type N-terminal cleavage/methylation domain-containing protein [Lachnospiraceae bacterium YH-ros2228]